MSTDPVVNLTWLRESLTAADRGEDIVHAFGLSMDAARLMVDAPTYYWCYVKGYRVSNTTDALHGRLNPTGDHSRCGWVALVPVVGP